MSTYAIASKIMTRPRRSFIARAMYNLALLGDFDSAIYASNPVTIVLFHIVTLITVVVMLNVLIAIISE